MRFSFVVLALASFSLAACSDKNDAPPKQDGGTTNPPRWAAAVGASGTFLQTFDHVSWQARTLSDASLFGVACVGNLDGWAVGARGSIAHTTDGGGTWTWQTSGVPVDLHGVRFGDATHGLAVGDGGALVITNDAGAHWTTVKATSIDLHAATIASGSGTWLAVGAKGTVLRSIDDGAIWSTSTIDGASDLRGVATDVGAHLVLVVDAAGAIWSSTDAGLHFTLETNAPASLDAIAIDDQGGPALAVGAHGTVMLRDPLTRAWSLIPLEITGDLHAALVTSNGTRLYAAGDGGALFTRTNDAPTWSKVATGTTSALYGLEDL